MLNHITIMGRLTRDVEMRRTTSGKSVASFDIACDKPGKDAGASFIPCVAWEKTADFISQYFSKGSAIVLEGRLVSRQYETKEGHKRTVLEVVVSQAHFCGKKEDNPKKGDFVLLDDDDAQLPF